MKASYLISGVLLCVTLGLAPATVACDEHVKKTEPLADKSKAGSAADCCESGAKASAGDCCESGAKAGGGDCCESGNKAGGGDCCESGNKAGDSKEQNIADAVKAIDPAKKKAIDELMQVTGQTERTQAIKEAFEHHASRTFHHQAAQALKSEGSSEKIQSLVAARADAMTKKYNQLFETEFDLDSTIKLVATNAYAKHFSTEEIKDITKFYKTSTGRKARSVMPEVSKESLQQARGIMEPKLKDIVSRVIAEDKEQQKKGKVNTADAGAESGAEADGDVKTETAVSAKKQGG